MVLALMKLGMKYEIKFIPMKEFNKLNAQIIIMGNKCFHYC